jgi:hypothetical protein
MDLCTYVLLRREHAPHPRHILLDDRAYIGDIFADLRSGVGLLTILGWHKDPHCQVQQRAKPVEQREKQEAQTYKHRIDVHRARHTGGDAAENALTAYTSKWSSFHHSSPRSTVQYPCSNRNLRAPFRSLRRD